jgi:hypothetical protein
MKASRAPLNRRVRLSAKARSAAARARLSRTVSGPSVFPTSAGLSVSDVASTLEAAGAGAARNSGIGGRTCEWGEDAFSRALAATCLSAMPERPIALKTARRQSRAGCVMSIATPCRRYKKQTDWQRSVSCGRGGARSVKLLRGNGCDRPRHRTIGAIMTQCTLCLAVIDADCLYRRSCKAFFHVG